MRGFNGMISNACGASHLRFHLDPIIFVTFDRQEVALEPNTWGVVRAHFSAPLPGNMIATVESSNPDQVSVLVGWFFGAPGDTYADIHFFRGAAEAPGVFLGEVAVHFAAHAPGWPQAWW